VERSPAAKGSTAVWGAKRLAEFEAAIDHLEQAVSDCPEARWDASVWVVKKTDPWVWPKDGPGDGRTEEAIQVFSSFWLIAYHCLFFLDMYLWDCVGRWATPPEFANGPVDQGIDEYGAARFPNIHYTPEQLLEYVRYCRSRARQVLRSLTERQLRSRTPAWHPHAGKTFKALLNVNLTHVREHSQQLADFVASRPASAGQHMV
jgi:hypothetical protein